MQALGIKSYKKLKPQSSLDFEVDHPLHNFLVEGIVSSNSHSTSYSALSSATLFLREKHPLVFFTSLLNHARFEPEMISEVAAIQAGLKYYNTKLLPPHLLLSEIDFKIENGDIRYGLGSIKGISDKVIEKLLKFRQPYMNKIEMFSAAKEAGINIGVLCGMIYCGCLSDVVGSKDRGRIALEANLFNLLTDKEKKLVFDIAPNHKFDVLHCVDFLRKTKDSKGKLFIKESRFETIKKSYIPWKEVYSQNLKHNTIANLFYEIWLLGYSFSSTLFDAFKGTCGVAETLVPISAINDLDDKTHVEFFGRVVEEKKAGAKKGIKINTSKKGTRYLKLELRDSDSSVTGMIFSGGNRDNIAAIQAYNQGNLPEDGSIVHCIGRKNGDAVFIDKMAIQDVLIYKKWAQLKKKREAEEETKF